MHVTHLLPLTLVSCVLAATPVVRSSVNIFAVAYPVVAYVLESEKDVATTYLVACRKGIETKACDFNQPYTLTEGPKTARWSYVASSGGLAQQLTLGCVLDGTTSMGCKATGLADEGETTTETFTWTGEEAATRFKYVAIVTDSSSLLTHSPVKSTSSTAASHTKSSTSLASSSRSSSTKAGITPLPTKTKEPPKKLLGPVSSSTTTASHASTSSADDSENPLTPIGSKSISSLSSTVTVTAPSVTPTATVNGVAPSSTGAFGRVMIGGMAVLAVLAARL